MRVLITIGHTVNRQSSIDFSVKILEGINMPPEGPQETKVHRCVSGVLSTVVVADVSEENLPWLMNSITFLVGVHLFGELKEDQLLHPSCCVLPTSTQ